MNSFKPRVLKIEATEGKIRYFKKLNLMTVPELIVKIYDTSILDRVLNIVIPESALTVIYKDKGNTKFSTTIISDLWKVISHLNLHSLHLELREIDLPNLKAYNQLPIKHKTIKADSPSNSIKDI